MSRRVRINQFSSSDAKDYIRDIIDRNIIASFKQEYYSDRRLAYLGLPGEKLLDVLSWREFIGRWTGIQVADNPENAAVADRLVHNVLLNRMEHGFHRVCANIDELLSTEVGQNQLRWPYQIVNLDYNGGLINAAADGTSRRLQALRGLFTRQIGTAFVLFLTLNLRDRDDDQLAHLLNAQEEELLALERKGVSECFTEHRVLGHAGELKIYVPIFLGTVANQHSLAFSPPILYQGTRQMIHFAVRCVPYPVFGAGRIFGTKDRISLINLPLLVIHGRDDLRSIQLGCID